MTFSRINLDKIFSLLSFISFVLDSTYAGATALYNPGNNNGTLLYDPEAGELKIRIGVFSSPPPRRFSLSMRHGKTANFASVSSQHYSVKYIKSTLDSMTGTIELSVATSEVMEGRQISFFSFTANNGIIGKTDFEYLFTARDGEAYKHIKILSLFIS